MKRSLVFKGVVLIFDSAVSMILGDLLNYYVSVLPDFEVLLTDLVYLVIVQIIYLEDSCLSVIDKNDNILNERPLIHFQGTTVIDVYCILEQL